MKNRILIILAAIAITASCQDKVHVGTDGRMKWVSIEVGTDEATKAGISSQTGIVSWKYGDKMSVLATDNRFYTFEYADPSSEFMTGNTGTETLYDEVLWSDVESGTQKGMPALFVGQIPEAAEITDVAVFPAIVNDGAVNDLYSGETLDYELPSEYTWKSVNTPVPMVAFFGSGAQAVGLRQVGAVLRMNVRNVQAGTRIVFTFPGNEVTGVFSVSASGENLPCISIRPGSSEVSVNFAFALQNAQVDIPVPVGVIETFRVDVYDKDAVKVRTKDYPSRYDIGRSAMVHIGDIVLDEPEKDEVVQFSVASPNMQISLPKPSKNTRMAVVTCPGGGYNSHSMTYEGTVWHDFMNNLGIANVVLKYQLPKGNPQTTISDVEAAFAYIREHSEEWGIDPEKIGIMGFSAGGHIASTIATHSAAASPSFQILFYPVITMDASGTHAVTMQNFLGTSPAADLVTLYSNEKQVTSATPECFLTYTQNDQLVPYLTNGKAYYDALVKAGVNVTLKAYESTSWPANGHGWAGYGNFPYKSDVESALSSWLKSL